MTFTPELERAARAMYEANPIMTQDLVTGEPLGPCSWERLGIVHKRRKVSAFAAGLRTLADPVSKAVVEAIAPIADPIRWKDERWRKGVRERTRAALTSYIHEIVGKEADHD